METVLLAGAGGKTGREVLARLTATDHRVRALTRSDAKVDRLERAGADEVVVGDLLDEADAERAVEGADAVVTCVGSTPVEVLGQAARGGELVDGRGNANLVEAAARAGVDRFVMQSSLGVGDDRASLMAWSFRLLVGPAVRAKTRAERALGESGLTYTVLRPGVLTNRGVTGDVRVADAPAGLWGLVSRADVARLLVAALHTPDAADRTLEVVWNPLVADRAPTDGADIDWHHPERKP